MLKICRALRIDPSDICLEEIPGFTQQMSNSPHAVQANHSKVIIQETEAEYKKKIISTIAKSENVDSDCKLKVIEIINEL